MVLAPGSQPGSGVPVGYRCLEANLDPSVRLLTQVPLRPPPISHGDAANPQLGSAEARAIYHANYWSTVRRAMRMLQETVGVAVDGVFGPLTLRAVVAAAPDLVIDRLARARRTFYDQLVQRDPAQAGFSLG